ncbi:MAG: DUF2851 family protein [Vicingaceae bacterium]
MNEDFLHYIWKFQQFNPKNLEITSGEKLQVLKVGLHNLHSGPDFFNGQVRIGNTHWAGNIEIHTKSSDWNLHKHQDDAIYDKVILHVVWENDLAIYRKNGEEIPTLELKGRIRKRLLDRFQELTQNSSWIPCEAEMPVIDSALKRQLIDQKLVERLQRKANRVEQLLKTLKNDWEAVLFQQLAKYFGFKVNAIPFEIMTTSLPFQLIRKHQTNKKQLTALLFGQAGFLEVDFKDTYPKELKGAYEFLRNKHKLSSIDSSIWKFMRMRPANFPTIRLAQFAACLYQQQGLFQTIIETKNLSDLRLLLRADVNEYWETHFHFDKISKVKSDKRIGKASIDILIINAIVPLIFTYGRHTDQEEYQESAMFFLQELKAEKNKITRSWARLNVPLDSAYESQALIQLKTEHCDFKNCLLCTIGNHILKEQHHD